MDPQIHRNITEFPSEYTREYFLTISSFYFREHFPVFSQKNLGPLSSKFKNRL